MCFVTTDTKQYTVIFPIVCYKIMFLTNDGLKSLVRDFPYVLKKLYKTEFVQIYTNYIHSDKLIMLEGFHSYKNKRNASLEFDNVCNRFKKIKELKTYDEQIPIMVKCIIPIGAKYYQNEDYYVSDKIKIKKIYKLNNNL